ncbi:MAG: tetratricopeptide repeat protein [Ignavibacteria bacterium]|jgi:tetratricopeptide (TPR) repeat protein
MKKTALIYIFFILLFGCSSSEIVNKPEKDEILKSPLEENQENNKTKALEYFINGSISEMKGNYAEAIIEYQEALRLDMTAGIHYALGKNYFRLNKLRSALQHSKLAHNIEPENHEYNYLLARVYSSANLIDSSINVYRRIIRSDSSQYKAYFELGKLYELDKPIKAKEVYDKLLEITGPQWEVLVRIADLNERLGNIDETISTVKELIELNPTSVELKKILIEAYIKTARYEEAINLANETLKLFPFDVNLLEYKANALVQLGKWDEGAKEYTGLANNPAIPFDSKLQIGLALFRQSLKDSTLLKYAKDIFTTLDKDSLNYQVKIYLGEIAIKEFDDSTAIKNFKIATELAGWNPEIWMRLGGLLFDNQRYTETTEEMGKALQNFPDDFVLNIYMGLSLSQENNHKEAEPYLKKSVELQPEDLTALSAYGFTLYSLDRNDEALAVLEKTTSVDDSNINILGVLGLIYDSKKMYDKSDSIYAKAVEIDSENSTVLNNFAYSLAERGIDLERALNMVSKALEQEPGNSSFLDTIGWVYFQLGDYEKAKEYIEQSLEGDPGSATVLEHLGDVYFKLGKQQKAIEYWTESLKKDESNTDLKLKLDKGKL